MDPKNQQAQPVSPQLAQQPQQVQQPVQPVSVPVGAGKEGGPVGETQAPPLIMPTEISPVLHPELEKAGVEVAPNHEQPHVSQELQHIIQSAPAVQQPIIPQPVTQGPVLPMTAVQATITAKTKKWHESVTWLAIYVLRQLKLLEPPKEGEKK